MSDGDLRRPPLLWEQRLQALIPNLGVQGVADSEVISDSPPGPGGGDEEPSDPPVIDEDPSTPRVPSAPVVAGVTLGLVISWDGDDFDGDPMPLGSYVDVHVSTVSGFTPSGATLVGRITNQGSFTYTAGTPGTTYYVRLVGFGPDGVEVGVSAQASASPGLVQGPDINGDAVITQIVAGTAPATTYALGSIWLNTANGSYNVLEDVGGTPTWVQRPWDTAGIAANAITANQIASQAILTKFLTGEVIRTGTSPSARVEISAANGIEVFRDATNKTFWAKPTGEVIFGTSSVSSAGTTVIDGGSITTGTVTGRTIQTSSGNNRVQLTDSAANSGDSVGFYYNGARVGSLYGASIFGEDGIYSTGRFIVQADLITYGKLVANATSFAPGLRPLSSSLDLFLMSGTDSGYLNAQKVYDQTSGLTANVTIGSGGRLARATSSERYKFEIVSLNGEFSGVSEAKITSQEDSGSVDFRDVLALSPAQFMFRRKDLLFADPETEQFPPEETAPSQMSLGFIAEDVAAKFPIACEYDDEGRPDSYDVRAIVSALLAVVQDQQAQIDALTARLDSLQ